MTTFAAKFNHSNFGIDTHDFNFVKLSDLYNGENGGADYIRKIDGVYIHKSKMGESPVFINCETKQLINIPQHLTDTCREILADEEAVEAIKNGKVGFVIYEYESHSKKCYSVNFVDLF